MGENNEVMSNEVNDMEINNAWDDGEGVSGAPETPAAEPKAETPPPAENAEQKPAEGQQAQADQPELFTLKNRDETRQVSKEDLIAMAQKGWDYDTVRTERDQLRQYRQEADPALTLVKDYAVRMNMTVPQYLDYCREQELRAGGKTETEAKNIIAQEKREADLTKREQAVEQKEKAQTSAEEKAKQAAQARMQTVQEFTRAYPNVDPKTIPQEVWADAAKGISLTNAYTMYENRRLQAELAAERQNKTNKASAPGSLGGNTVTEADEIDRLWAEDDD